MTILTTDEAASLARQAREHADEIDDIAAKLPDDGSALGGPLREAALDIEAAATMLRDLAEHLEDTARSDDERAEHESKLEDDLAEAQERALNLAENIGARLDFAGWDEPRIIDECRRRGFYLTGEDAVDCLVRLLEDRPHFPVPANMRGDLKGPGATSRIEHTSTGKLRRAHT